jgi:hypothetical protein
MIFLPLVFTVLAYIYLAFRSTGEEISFLSPACVTVAGCIFLFGLGPFFHFNEIELSFELLLSIALMCAGICLAFDLFSKDTLSSYHPVDKPSDVTISRARRLAIFISVLLGIAAFTSVFAQLSRGLTIVELYRFDTFNEAVANSGSNVGTWDAKVYDVGIKVSIFLFLTVIGPLTCDNSRSSNLLIALVNGIYLVALLSRYGGRQGVIALVMITMFTRISQTKVVPKVRLAGLVAVVTFVFFTLQLVRHYDPERHGSFSLEAIINSVGSGGEWERIECLTDIIARRTSEKLGSNQRIEMLLEIVKNFLINWVPRVLWEAKPQTDWTFITSGEMYGHLYSSENWVRNFTVLGQGYYLGSEIGAAVIGFLYASATGLGLYLCRGRSEYLGFRAVVVLYSLYSLGNNFTTFLFYIASFLLIGRILVYMIYPDRKRVRLGLRNGVTQVSGNQAATA